MKTTRIKLTLTGPLLPGCISTARSTCGKPQCACKAHPPKLHGVYYRWTGLIDGKRTTRTLTKAQAQECQRRIKNFRKMQKHIHRLVIKALAQAPWKGGKL